MPAPPNPNLLAVSPELGLISAFPIAGGACFEPLTMGRIVGIPGVPSPARGSMVYPAVWSFGYLLGGGWATANRGRKGLARTARGIEDGRSSVG